MWMHRHTHSTGSNKQSVVNLQKEKAPELLNPASNGQVRNLISLKVPTCTFDKEFKSYCIFRNPNCWVVMLLKHQEVQPVDLRVKWMTSSLLTTLIFR